MGEIIKERDELLHRVEQLRRSGTLVLADGTFDPFHAGHIDFLETAKGLGDLLVVALRSDAAARSNRGPERPLNPWPGRARVLSATRSVDIVAELDERHPDELIRLLKPAVYAKGTDFIEANVRERELVESLGGKVVICGGPKMRVAAGGASRSGFRSAWEGARDVPPRPGQLSIIVPTKNEEHNIRPCLESAVWADEVIVCDSFSTDRTCKIAAEFTPNVVQHEYVHSAAQKNWIIPQAAGEWVMILDADERVTPELREAVMRVIKDGNCDGYRIARRTYFLGKLIRHCGWNRDYPLRLFRRDKGRYQDREVHSAVMVDGTVGRINECLMHYTDPDLRNYFEKFDRYSSLSAADLFRRGVRARWWHLILKPPGRFVKMYLLNLGVLDGFHGLLLCGLTAMALFARYAKLWEMNRRGSVGELPSGRRS